MSKFEDFQSRLKELRKEAEEYADKDAINKNLDIVEKAWSEAAKAADLAKVESVANALASTQRSADVLAYNILFCNTAEVAPSTLLAHVVKFQALEQIRGVFSTTMAESMEESVGAQLLAEKIEIKA